VGFTSVIRTYRRITVLVGDHLGIKKSASITELELVTLVSHSGRLPRTLDIKRSTKLEFQGSNAVVN